MNELYILAPKGIFVTVAKSVGAGIPIHKEGHDS